jgi:LysR family transcriptional regulator, glycine cleavage system transcriptional activator
MAKKVADDRSRLPPLNAVRAFEAAARHRNFTAAAADLHVTHWAIGKQIKLLEDWLGVPLFERQARGVALTGEGAELLADASEALSRLAAAAARFRRPDAAPRVAGTVRINVPTSFAQRWLIPRMAEFQRLFPNIELRISVTSRRLRYVGTASDLGVRLNWQPTHGYRSQILTKDWQLPACSPDLLRRRPVTSAGDLRRHVLLHSATTRPAWPRWLAAAGEPDLSPRRHIEFEHVHLQLQAAVEGLGVAIASKPLIERDLAAGRLVCPIATPEADGGDYVLVSEDRPETAPTKALRQWMLAAAEGETIQAADT